MNQALHLGSTTRHVPNFQRCIFTYSGEYVDIFEPNPDSIKIVDIAHQLALINCFNGVTRTPYSYAQRAVLVMNAVRPEHRLAALLQDAAKAYTNGFRNSDGSALGRDTESYLQAVINNHFGLGMLLNDDVRDMIRMAKLMVLATERRDLLAPDHQQWPILNDVRPLTTRIRTASWQTAETDFLAHFKNLTGLM